MLNVGNKIMSLFLFSYVLFSPFSPSYSVFLKNCSICDYMYFLSINIWKSFFMDFFVLNKNKDGIFSHRGTRHYSVIIKHWNIILLAVIRNWEERPTHTRSRCLLKFDLFENLESVRLRKKNRRPPVKTYFVL